MSDYTVILKISRRFISFEYNQEGSERGLKPFPGVKWPVPMAFYALPAGFEIGEGAEKAAQSNNKNAFKDWFSHLGSNSTFNYGGRDYPVNQMLLLASEDCFRKFLRDVRYNNDGTLEQIRGNFPLAICFEDNVDENKNIYVRKLFSKAGYGNLMFSSVNRFLLEAASQIIPDQYVLIADSDGVDFTLSLFNKNESKPLDIRVLSDLGSDPRVEILAEEIWNNTGAYSYTISKAREIPKIKKIVKRFLNSDENEISDEIEYSDGSCYPYFLSKRRVNTMQLDAGEKLRMEVEKFLKDNNIEYNNVALITRNLAATNDYFHFQLSRNFSHILPQHNELKEETNRLLIQHFIELGKNGNRRTNETIKEPQPTPPADSPADKIWMRKWKGVKAEAGGKIRSNQYDNAKTLVLDFLKECRENNKSNLIEEVEKYLKSFTDLIDIPSSDQKDNRQGPPLKTEPKANESEIKKLISEWREVRSEARALSSTLKFSEARRILENYLDRCLSVGYTDKKQAIEDEIRKIEEAENKKNSEGSSKPHFERPSREEVKRGIPKPEPAVPMEDEGKALLNQDKLSEARDWYKNKGNTTKSRYISQIIRSKNSVTNRELNLENNRQNVAKIQLDKIIEELSEFADLCEKVGYKAQKYKNLLLEYKKIKPKK